MSALRSRRLPLVVAGLVALAALVALAWGQWWLAQQRSRENARTDARDAADRAVATVLSYDYRRLDAGMEAARALLTGDFRQQYDELQEPLRRSAPVNKSVVSARVADSTVLSADDNSARVLLFVDQTSTSSKLPSPQLDQSRVVVTLQRDGDQWLVSALSAV